MEFVSRSALPLAVGGFRMMLDRCTLVLLLLESTCNRENLLRSFPAAAGNYHRNDATCFVVKLRGKSTLDTHANVPKLAATHLSHGTDFMPTISIDGVGDFQVPAGKRLVNALTDECGQDQLHACGGMARCTTCRVKFLAGEPDAFRPAEEQVLAAKGLAGQPGIRLSCQILCDNDMSVQIISRLAGSGRKDAGARPADVVQP
jgi:ferredoxin